MAPPCNTERGFSFKKTQRVGECILLIREDWPAGFVCFHNPIFPVGHCDINYLQNLSLNWQSVLTVSKHFPHSYFFNAFSDWSKKARDMVQALKKLNEETKIAPHEIYHWDQHGESQFLSMTIWHIIQKSQTSWAHLEWKQSKTCTVHHTVTTEYSNPTPECRYGYHTYRHKYIHLCMHTYIHRFFSTAP